MRIAFDAKRAFNNHTGLGQYSRNLLTALAEEYPQHEYFLATPKLTDTYQPLPGMQLVQPAGWQKLLPSLWRSNGVRHDLRRLNIDLYHGLSHEIPVGLKGIKSVVTMHDLVFERYPKQYKAVDVAIYRKKFKYACAQADMVIAISHQTSADLQEFYNVPAERIRVCYQSCNPAYGIETSVAERARVRQQYKLPAQYMLYVGSVIERKNLLTICKAIAQLENGGVLPLVVIGKGSAYMQEVKNYVQQQGIQDKVLFLSEQYNGVASVDMPAIYQAAEVMIYPSVYEGFGIPVLESLWSRVPVITSNLSCMPETGGDAAYYIDPLSTDEMASAIVQVTTNPHLRAQMIEKGWAHAQHFTAQKCAQSVMQVYEEVMRK